MTLLKYVVYIIYTYCILFPIQLLAQTTSEEATTKLAVISDLHYLSSDLRDIGYKTQEVSTTTGKNVIASSEVLDNVVLKLDSADIDVLLISGDLTFDGEKLSHLELKEKLNKLRDNGVKIFVIPGNHDIHSVSAKGYKGNTVYSTESITEQVFVDIYSDFGFDKAISRDPNSLSYVGEIDSTTWLLALDVGQHGLGMDHNIGKLSKVQLEWVQSILGEAKTKNKNVIAMMHWGLLEHIPMQSKLLPTYLVDDASNLQSILADGGVKVVFTGHFHANDINAFETEKGNTIYDVATGALVSYPYAIRYVDLNKNYMQVKTCFIYGTPSYPSLRNDSRTALLQLAKQRSLPYLQKLGIKFSETNLELLSQLVAKYFVDAMGGDETFSKEDIQLIRNIFEEEGFPISDSLETIDIDNSIADSDLLISFSTSK